MNHKVLVELSAEPSVLPKAKVPFQSTHTREAELQRLAETSELR